MSGQFYILDARSCVGNCALWWRPDGRGYTCELNEAGLYDEEYAGGLRDTDIPVPVEVAKRLSVVHVRLDHLREELGRLSAARQAVKP